MTQEELSQKRNDDLFAQYLRACRVDSLEKKAKRRKKENKYNHDFVILELEEVTELIERYKAQPHLSRKKK